ncbi:TPM domain-containing protein [Candidatus Phycosocius spiralis]|uniref:TPM domain-containing protein n=1 Tax=Candidatus Phycosocius spiralis TaxID=2815099 RepID=A0ABQ4PSV3_9PROT|nr:TPM domain-containing protein [Candidatus Phycosocius spiralis]GIU66077.1 hypothetical protein PsB1_0231 [Candidatus Phycosocius spiralis]
MVTLAPQGLNADQKKSIVDAIVAAELKTAGEIVVVVARKSSDYNLVPWVYGIAIACCFPLLLLAFGFDPITLAEWVHASQSGGWRLGVDYSAYNEAQIGMVLIVIAQVLIVMLAQTLGRFSWVRDLLTPIWIKRQQVHQAALDQFVTQAMQETQARTGVLIYVSLKEKQAEIVADTGIYTKVDQGVWRDVIQDLVSAACAGDLAQGLVGAVAASATILAPHFPPIAGDANELSNKVILI